MLFLCNRKFRWNSLLHKKALRARKRSSRRGIYSCAIRSRAKVCVKRTLCSYIDIIFSAEKKLSMGISAWYNDKRESLERQKESDKHAGKLLQAD